MSEFDDFIRGIGSDIKLAAEQVSKKTEEAFEISKRRAEKLKLKGRIQANYQHLGEIVYGGMKNEEDVSEEVEKTIALLDEDFARIQEIFEEINAIKNGTFVPETEEEDWEEEYAEGYDEAESEEEMEVSIVVMEEDGEVTEEPAVIETEEEYSEESQEFDINID